MSGPVREPSPADDSDLVVIEPDAGPWPTETWGPLLPEHFALRTLNDLAKLPPVEEGGA